MNSRNKQTGNADIQTERKHLNMLKGVENFDATQLKKTETIEKAILPNFEGSLMWCLR